MAIVCRLPFIKKKCPLDVQCATEKIDYTMVTEPSTEALDDLPLPHPLYFHHFCTCLEGSEQVVLIFVTLVVKHLS